MEEVLLMTKLMKAYKFRIYPDKGQMSLINQTIGASRALYNKMLADKVKHYEIHKEALNNTPAQYKEEYPWMRDVDSQALSQAHQDLNAAYRNFFQKQNKFPKFKKKGVKDTYRSCVVNNNIRIEDGKLKLPKVGLVEIRMERQLPTGSKIKNVTISRTKSNKYFASIQFEFNKEINKVKPESFLGLDFAMQDFYVDSEGRKGSYPKFYRNSQKKLAREQRKLSKMVKGSNNCKKQKVIVAKVYEKVANQRKDFLHKTSRKIANSYDVVCVETLNMQAMSKSLNFGKTVHDIGWRMFTTMLDYKLSELGKILVRADKFFPSTKQCSSCKHKKDKVLLNERWYECYECGYEEDRDINAAINLRNYAIESLLI